MSLKRLFKAPKKILDFEKSHTKNLWKGLKDDPKRLFLGVDPFSTKMWNKALGRDDRALVNQLGGATSYDYEKALEEGIDIGPGQALHTVAGAVAGAYAGGALGEVAGAGVGAVAGPVAPTTQTAITAGTRMAVPAATAALEEPLEMEEETPLGGLGSLRLGNVPVYRRAEGGRVPSKSPAQAKLMRAVAHGWKPNRIKGPSRAVAREFADADRKYSGGFAENRYWTGGLAAMNEVNSGVPETLNWQEGGEVDDSPLTGEAAYAAAMNPSSGNLRAVDLTGFKSSGMAGMFRSLMEQSLGKQGFYAGENNIWYPAQETFTSGSSTPSSADLTPDLRGGDSPAGTPFMPTVIPQMTPEERAAWEAQRAEETAAKRQGPHREQMREHKARIVAALNPASIAGARGGHMKYQEGGDVPAPDMRQGLEGEIIAHAEGPNPYNFAKTPSMYRQWERRHHKAPPPPPQVAAVQDEGGGALSWLIEALGLGDTAEDIGGRTQQYEEQMEAEARGEARGGPVRRYQVGGLAQVQAQPQESFTQPPTGGVPPRWSGAQRQQWRGAAGDPTRRQNLRGAYNSWSPQQQSGYRGRVGRQQPPAPPPPKQWSGVQRNQWQGTAGDPTRRQNLRGAYGSWSPEQQAGYTGRVGYQPQAPAQAPPPPQAQAPAPPQAPPPQAPPQAQPKQWSDVQQQQWRNAGRVPGSGQRQQLQKAYQSYTPEQRAGYTGRVGFQFGGAVNPGGFMGQVRQMAQQQRAAQPGGPGRGPDVGGGITGGARVPPNLTGYLQKQRMMNRPPSNVGGGVNRVGQQDQQGALSRAMQRGTGRRPMSRRGGFPGRGGVR